MKRLEKILFLFILLVLILPALQKELLLFPELELSGDYTAADKPDFSFAGWYAGHYQSDLDNYLNDNNGFNHFLVRLNNQLDYSLFRYIHADGVIQGKNHELFEYDYIRSYTGLDYIGADLMERKIKKLKFVQTYMKDSLDINFIFVLEPGKASFYPELIPGKYLRKTRPQNNYKEILKQANKYGVDYIDFNAWFTALKKDAAYPLYANHGTHWSIYGMSLAADSLLNLIAHRRSIKLREVYADSLVVEHRARRPDYDMAAAMNLLFPLKEQKPLAYPVYRFEEDALDKDYPMVLVVGDSYYWNIYNTGIPQKVFKNHPYYYFGKLVYPEHYSKPTFVKDLDLKTEVEKQDVLLLMTTERFLYKFDWQIIDQLYSFYGPVSSYDLLYEKVFSIVSNDEWFSSILEKAKRKNLSVEETLIRDGKFLLSQDDPDTYLLLFGVEEFEQGIRRDENWLASVQDKATENNVDLNEMIHLDAEYMFFSKHPEIFEKYKALQKYKATIQMDPKLSEETKKEAAYYYRTFEEMLQIKAEQMLN